MRLATVPIGRLEPVGDHAVGLVAREEAIEQLAAGLVEAREGVADVHRLLDVREPVLAASSGSPSSAARATRVAAIRSRQSRLATCAIHGRIASSSRSVPSRS